MTTQTKSESVDGPSKMKFNPPQTATTRPGNLFTEHVSDEYHSNLKTGYSIPLVTYGVAGNRRLKVITIGAGFSGIMLAYNIDTRSNNVEHVIYEKNSNLGGTWFQNRYPNAACDAPSCVYQMNFALNPDWPKFYSESESINDYMVEVVDKLDLKKYMNFNSEVISANFNENLGTWKVTIKQNLADGSVREIVDDCDLLLGAIGVLDRWEYPKIPGLDTFKGRIVHTAGWDKNYGPDQWNKERVAVIGSGSSSLQTVPGMQPYAKHLDVFVRTGVWFFSHDWDESKPNTRRPHSYQYTEKEKLAMRNDHQVLLHQTKQVENQLMMLFHYMVKYSPHYPEINQALEKRMRKVFQGNEYLIQGFTPKFSVGCRRIAPGDRYIEAVQKPNVKVHFTGVSKVIPEGVVSDDGQTTECDTIVCATGFDVSYRPKFSIVGLNGTDLREKWKYKPEGYFGLACPEIPNYLTYIGPNWPVENGSIMGPLTSVIEYTLKIISKMQTENIKYWVPKQSVTDDFNQHTQTWFKGTVWEENCNAWYKNRETGHVNAIWPGSALHYMECIKEPRYEDFDIEYHNPENRFAFLGNGFTTTDLDFSEDSDRSPHFSLEKLEPRYYN